MKYIKIPTVLIVIIIVIVLSGCFFGTPIEKTVTPTIRAIGIPGMDIINSITLKVTDSADTVIIEETFTSIPEEINVSVPEGNDLTFKLTINMGSASAIASYSGSAMATITEENTIIDITMGIERTRILIPDANNNRIVQIDDMTGAGWSTRSWTDLGYTNGAYEFEPRDIDIDQNGNIYIANNSGDSPSSGIIKINSIDLISVIPLPASYHYLNQPVSAIAIDQKNERIYGITGNAVYYWNLYGLPNASNLFFSPGSGESISGIAIDQDGNVYLGGDEGNGGPWVSKFSSAGTQLNTYSAGGPSFTVRDLTILNGELFVTLNNPLGSQIEKYDVENISNGSIASFGTHNTGGAESEFYGAYNFLATQNNRLTVIDYFFDGGSLYYARLVSFNDIDGSEWTTFGSYGSAEDQFTFFN